MPNLCSAGSKVTNLVSKPSKITATIIIYTIKYNNKIPTAKMPHN